MEQLGSEDEAGDWKEQNTCFETFETFKTTTKKPTCVSVFSPNPTLSGSENSELDKEVTVCNLAAEVARALNFELL